MSASVRAAAFSERGRAARPKGLSSPRSAARRLSISASGLRASKVGEPANTPLNAQDRPHRWPPLFSRLGCVHGLLRQRARRESAEARSARPCFHLRPSLLRRLSLPPHHLIFSMAGGGLSLAALLRPVRCPAVPAARHPAASLRRFLRNVRQASEGLIQEIIRPLRAGQKPGMAGMVVENSTGSLRSRQSREWPDLQSTHCAARARVNSAGDAVVQKIV